MEKEEKKSTNQCGEETITIQPQKVEKLEADEYLLEKALKAHENAIERMRRKKLTTMRLRKARRHNEAVRRRKTERKNKREGRK